MDSTSNVNSSEALPVPPDSAAQTDTPRGGGSTGSDLCPLSIRSEALEKFAQREVKALSIQAWAAGTGIPMARIREELDRLPDGLTWKTAAGTIMLSPEAWTELWRVFGLDAVLGKEPPAPKIAENEAPPLVRLTVLHIPRNPRILEATDENGARVRVRVRDSARWKPRQTLEARLVSPGLYESTTRPPRRWGDPL